MNPAPTLSPRGRAVAYIQVTEGRDSAPAALRPWPGRPALRGGGGGGLEAARTRLEPSAISCGGSRGLDSARMTQQERVGRGKARVGEGRAWRGWPA